MIILFIVIFAGWLFYQLQKRIGEIQAAEWEEFKIATPHFFKIEEHQITKLQKDAKTKEFLDGVWARHAAYHAQYCAEHGKL